MPFVNADGARIYWRCDGREDRPTLLLGNSIGTDHSLWDSIVPDLARSYRVLRFDMRGHGASDAPAGDYTIERLARDALAVAAAAGAMRFSYAGISLGGMVGIWLGVHAAARVERLALCNTAAYLPPEAWATRIAAVRGGGMGAIVDMVMGRFFSPAFVARGDARFATVRRTFLSLAPEGYIGCCAAIRDMDQRAALPLIKSATLVVAGALDQATPPSHGRAIAEKIAGAQYVELPCSHLPHFEARAEYVACLLDFLAGGSIASERERYDVGLARRKEVLGAGYVEARLANHSPLTDEFQNLITRYAWGEMWTRPTFDDRTRRLLVLAMMVANKSWEEFEMHLRAGLPRDISAAEVREVLLLAAIYCGVPAANTAFVHARKIVEEQANSSSSDIRNS